MSLISFTSDALGTPHDYRSWWSDQVMIVVTARKRESRPLREP